jgi:hypothetical protein
MGLYMLLGMLFVLLVIREVAHGPEAVAAGREPYQAESEAVRAQGGAR